MELSDEEANGLSGVGNMLNLLDEELKSLQDESPSDNNTVTDANNAKDSNTPEKNSKK